MNRVACRAAGGGGICVTLIQSCSMENPRGGLPQTIGHGGTDEKRESNEQCTSWLLALDLSSMLRLASCSGIDAHELANDVSKGHRPCESRRPS